MVYGLSHVAQLEFSPATFGQPWLPMVGVVREGLWGKEFCDMLPEAIL